VTGVPVHGLGRIDFRTIPTVKSLIQTGYGEPGKVLELRDVPEQAPGKGEVLIDLEAAVVQTADLRTVVGTDKFRKKLPRTPGYEGVGRIKAVGDGVVQYKVGDRVFAPTGVGTFRQQVTVAEKELISAPEGDAIQVALLSTNPAAALMMLQDFVKLEPGQWLVQNAANSAIGRLVIQLAKEMKLKVVNVVKSSPLISELKELGANAVLLDTPDLHDRVAAVTESAKIRLGLDAVGGSATAALARCLTEDATLVNYGAMSGEACELPSHLLSAQGITLRGMLPARQLARHNEEDRAALHAKVSELLSAGKLQARIAATYPLEDAINALNHVQRDGDKRFGKVALRIQMLAAPAATAPAPAEPAVEAAAPAETAPADAPPAAAAV
jgi:mitochondrial enoyl-[acyl-carrier protein] reductase / trans-2-enoyl-CoA reductase